MTFKLGEIEDADDELHAIRILLKQAESASEEEPQRALLAYLIAAIDANCIQQVSEYEPHGHYERG